MSSHSIGLLSFHLPQLSVTSGPVCHFLSCAITPHSLPRHGFLGSSPDTTNCFLFFTSRPLILQCSRAHISDFLPTPCTFIHQISAFQYQRHRGHFKQPHVALALGGRDIFILVISVIVGSSDQTVLYQRMLLTLMAINTVSVWMTSIYIPNLIPSIELQTPLSNCLVELLLNIYQ